MLNHVTNIFYAFKNCFKQFVCLLWASIIHCKSTEICIFSSLRTWTWPAASSGAFKCLSRAHGPPRAPGCSGEGAISKTNLPFSVLNDLKNSIFWGCFPPDVVNFVIRRQLSLQLRLPKTVLSISLLGRRCRQSCGSLPRAQPRT